MIGQPRVVTASHGFAMQEKKRLSHKELGGGALLDVGIYPIQLADIVFGPDKPEKIVATGTLLETGRYMYIPKSTEIYALFVRLFLVLINDKNYITAAKNIKMFYEVL